MEAIFSYKSLAPNFAALIGCIPTLIGATAIVRPESVLSILEFPPAKTPDAQKLTDSLSRIFGARALATGLLVLAIRFRGDRELLGWAMLILALLPFVDGVVSLQQIGGGAWRHWALVPLMIGISACLLN